MKNLLQRLLLRLINSYYITKLVRLKDAIRVYFSISWSLLVTEIKTQLNLSSSAFDFSHWLLFDLKLNNGENYKLGLFTRGVKAFIVELTMFTVELIFLALRLFILAFRLVRMAIAIVIPTGCYFILSALFGAYDTVDIISTSFTVTAMLLDKKGSISKNMLTLKALKEELEALKAAGSHQSNTPTQVIKETKKGDKLIQSNAPKVATATQSVKVNKRGEKIVETRFNLKNSMSIFNIWSLLTLTIAYAHKLPIIGKYTGLRGN